MKHWQVRQNTGFLMYPSVQNQSATHEILTRIQHIADNLPHDTQFALSQLRQLPYDDALLRLASDDALTAEWLFMMYGYFASAWVHGFGNTILPRQIAVPLTHIAAHLGRPPMLSYTGMVLTNWQLCDADGDFTPENVNVLVRFTDLEDEAWFFRVHIAIEAQAGAILHALEQTRHAISQDDDHAVLVALRAIRAGLVQITQTFHKMPDGCDPDDYFLHVRPYLHGFEHVIYDGVSDTPMTFRGGSGAQSSVVPAILAGLGVEHDHTMLTDYLNEIRRYMPHEHQKTIAQRRTIPLRQYCAERPPLRDAYNHALRQLVTFRRAHLYYARTYIFEKSPTASGTGGTDYMGFLSRLIDETERQML